MRGEVARDYKWSNGAFNALVKSHMEQHLGGRIVMVELHTSDALTRLLDLEAGFDAYAIEARGMRGLAVRVQSMNFSTWTIREERDSGADTELVKRIRALQHGYMYPHHTVQAYVCPAEPSWDGPVHARVVHGKPVAMRLLRYAMVPTRVLYPRVADWLEQGEPSSWAIWRQRGKDAAFLCVDFYRSKLPGTYVYEQPGPPSRSPMADFMNGIGK